MNKNILILFQVLLIFVLNTKGQINKNEIIKSLSLDFEVKQMHQHPLINKQFAVDPVVSDFRTIDTNQLTDNPFLHSALYYTLKTNFNYKNKDKYIIELNTFLEQRGWSFGNNNTNTTVVFPEFNCQINDTLKIGKELIKVKLKFGNLYFDKDYNDTRFYNIDRFGIDMSLNWRFLEWNFLNLTDMSWGIGTNIEELFRIGLSFNKKTKNNQSLKIGFNLDKINYYKHGYTLLHNEKDNY